MWGLILWYQSLGIRHKLVTIAIKQAKHVIYNMYLFICSAINCMWLCVSVYVASKKTTQKLNTIHFYMLNVFFFCLFPQYSFYQVVKLITGAKSFGYGEWKANCRDYQVYLVNFKYVVCFCHFKVIGILKYIFLFLMFFSIHPQCDTFHRVWFFG